MEAVTKYIIISHEPFRNKMREDFLMKAMQGKGIDAEYWCVQQVFKYSRKATYLNFDAATDVRYIKDKASLIFLLNSLPFNSIICLDIWYNWETLFLLKEINQRNFKVFAIDYYKNQPSMTSQKDKILRSLKQLDIKKIYQALKRHCANYIFSLWTKFLGICFPPIVFVPGDLAEKYTNKNTKYVSINHFNFMEYELARHSAKLVSYKYIVFLDIFLPYHPDISRIGHSSVSPAAYFAVLNSYFDEIESSKNVKIVIAAHPKARYTSEFQGRECFYGETANLVHYSEGVISHHSAALNFAVLARKKILLVYTNDFLDAKGNNYILKNMYDVIKGYESQLGCSLINISVDKNIELGPIDEERYARFIKNYILSSNFPKRNCEIVTQQLNLD